MGPDWRLGVVEWWHAADRKSRGILFRSGDTAQPDIEQMDSNGDGNATGGWGWTPNRDPIPQIPLWGPFLAPYLTFDFCVFSKNTKKNGDFEYKPGFFIPLYLRKYGTMVDLGVGSTKLKHVYNVCHPQSPLKKRGIRSYAAYPAINLGSQIFAYHAAGTIFA